MIAQFEIFNTPVYFHAPDGIKIKMYLKIGMYSFNEENSPHSIVWERFKSWCIFRMDIHSMETTLPTWLYARGLKLWCIFETNILFIEENSLCLIIMRGIQNCGESLELIFFTRPVVNIAIKNRYLTC